LYGYIVCGGTKVLPPSCVQLHAYVFQAEPI